MKRLYLLQFIRKQALLFSWGVFCSLLLGITQLMAQQASIPANKDGSTPFISTTALPTVSLAVTNTAVAGVGIVYWESGTACSVANAFLPPCGVNGVSNVINSSTADFARVHFLSAGGSARLRVTDNTAANTYSAGNFAGFVISNSSPLGASLLGTVTIATYNNGAFVEASTSNSLLGVNSSLISGAYEVGFLTTLPFDAIEIRFGGLVSADTYDVYYAVQRRFSNGPALQCNTRTPFVTSANSSTATGFPAAVNAARTGVTGPTTFTILNANNVTTSDLTDYASISAPLPVNVGGVSSVSLAVKDQAGTVYSAGTYAGFDIQNAEVIGASLLSSTTIKTYLGGALRETVTGSAGLASIPLLTATGRQTIGFVTSQTFDEVQIVFSFPATLSVGETRVYSTILKSLCAGPTIACSTSAVTPLTNTAFPVYINNNHTGTGSSLACVGCAINNAENVINGSTIAPATISLGAAVSATARLSVANSIDTYPAESFIGFDIESSTLIGASLLGQTRITLYNNGVAVQTGSGASLLVGATLLSSNRQTVGTIAQVPFDEVEIEFQQLVSANPLGIINVYRAVIQKACVTPIVCNQTRYLTSPAFSAFIEGTRTGFTGIGTLSALPGSNSIENPENVISASTTDYARITNTVGAGATASISVADPADVYPPGTFAGYTISRANFPISTNLFSNITVRTYLNGVAQESSTVSNLLDLSVILQIFGTSSSTLSNVGFYVTKPFDEIRLEVGSFASVANYVDVYGAFVDTRFSSNGGSLVCNFALNPDFNVTTKNVPVSGNVSTNDKGTSGSSYGTPVVVGTPPAGATITMSTNGTYSFTATNPGSYSFSVPVCAAGQTSCPATSLIITVLDPTVTTNGPVANPDYASINSSTATAGSVTINVRANDGPGNLGGTLSTPTIAVVPAHGAAQINGSGNLVYTPATGYIGDDVVTYQVCESPGALCATAQVVIHVLPPSSSTVSVGDDYAKTDPGVSVSGNVLANDQGTGLTVSNAGTIATSAGTLILTSTGSYTFTPATGVSGPVDFTYTACDNSATAVCGTATLHVLTTPAAPELQPDFNVTTKNVPVSGNASTNDRVPSGTTYGSPVAAGGNPSGGTITMNSNGSYNFTATNAGVYAYAVPVCAPNQSGTCPTTQLVITVLDLTIATNPPVANLDYINVQGASVNPGSVTSNIVANDGPGNRGGALSTPSIVVNPAHGVASIVGGQLIYTPTAGYYGADILSYEVCETPGGLCATANVIITVKAPSSTTVTVLDDYVSVTQNSPVSGNVLTNDLGTGLTVSNAGTIINPGQGTLVLSSTGSYTFTPATNVTGPVDFTYTACDNASVCGTATIHILVKTAADLTPVIYARPSSVYGNMNLNVVVEVYELNGVIANGTVVVKLTKDPRVVLNFSSTTTSLSSRPVQNSAWSFDDSSDEDYYILTANQGVSAGDVLAFGLTGTLSPGATSGALTLTTVIDPNSGGQIVVTNNTDADKIDYFQQ